ncbi:hypothetical protein [Streptomyces collinus]|uniref:hypothetical protein n=1 Tax=Streptomyces collinus TaxID=42684 RepID=UPI0033F6C444
MDDEVEQGGPDDDSVQCVVTETVPHGGGGQQRAGDDGAQVDAACAVGSEVAGLLAEQALHGGG